MIKALVFDYTNVIAQGAVINWIRTLPEGDIRRKQFAEHSHRWDMGEVGLDEAYRLMTMMTSVPEEKIWETFFEKSVLNDELVGLARKLKRQYKLYLFSNHLAPLLLKMMKNHKILDLFDELIISSDHKMKKPNPDFFKKMLSIVEAEKDEILFIDDTKENVDAGNNLGIKSILYTSMDHLRLDLEKNGVTIT